MGDFSGPISGCFTVVAVVVVAVIIAISTASYFSEKKEKEEHEKEKNIMYEKGKSDAIKAFRLDSINKLKKH